MKKLLSYVAGLVLVTSCISTAFAADECTECPGDVENLEATAYNGAVKLTWDEAEDSDVAGYVIAYGTEPVDGDIVTDYEDELDVGNVTEYVMTDLENDTEYFFSAYAYDEDDNESLYWAVEVSATPSVDAGDYEDTDAPQVSKAEAVDNETVKVVFSEAVVLPNTTPENEFEIENDDTFETLDVLSAEMDEDDEDGKTVLLTTDAQEEDATYKLTVGTGVEDKNGNVIISGTSDTALFEGGSDESVTDEEDNEEEEEEDVFMVVDVEVIDATHIMVNFNRPVVLDLVAPVDHFEITEEDDDTQTLEVANVELGMNIDLGLADAAVLIETAEQEDKTYVLTVSGVTDEDENELDEDENEAEFDGFAEEEEAPMPVDVEELMAEVVEKAETFLVKLTWDMPVGNDGVTVKQLLYMSEDGEDYDEEAELDEDEEGYELEGMEPGEYWFKLTQENEDGKETEGTSVKVVISETGPGVAGLVLVSLGLGRVFRKKRNQ